MEKKSFPPIKLITVILILLTIFMLHAPYSYGAENQAVDDQLIDSVINGTRNYFYSLNNVRINLKGTFEFYAPGSDVYNPIKDEYESKIVIQHHKDPPSNDYITRFRFENGASVIQDQQFLKQTRVGVYNGEVYKDYAVYPDRTPWGYVSNKSMNSQESDYYTYYLGLLHGKELIWDLLNRVKGEGKIIRTAVSETSNGPEIMLEYDVGKSGSEHFYQRYYFLQEKGYLPNKFISLYIKEGKEIIGRADERSDIKDYGKGIFLPSKISMIYGDVNDTSPTGHYEKREVNLTNVETNAEVKPEEFELKFPIGTVVRDEIKRVKYKEGDAEGNPRPLYRQPQTPKQADKLLKEAEASANTPNNRNTRISVIVIGSIILLAGLYFIGKGKKSA